MKRLFLGTHALLAAALFLLPLAALAAEPAEPSITFGASVTSGNGQLATRLTWSTAPAATSCTASGHPAWSGTKQASGSHDMPAITLSGTYTLTLSCTWPGDTTARLSWSAPTQYTDGSAIPAGELAQFRYRIHRGTSANSLTPLANTIQHPTTQHDVTGLSAGTHYFAVSALTGTGIESALSAVGSKTVVTTQTRQSAVTLTVNPVPAPPGGFTVR